MAESIGRGRGMPHRITAGLASGLTRHGTASASCISSWRGCMTSWLNTLAGWLRSSKAAIVCEPGLWNQGVIELRRRTLNGQRESGAFLLGMADERSKRILE